MGGTSFASCPSLCRRSLVDRSVRLEVVCKLQQGVCLVVSVLVRKHLVHPLFCFDGLLNSG